jgi:protein O-mannosyl-transferase
MTEPRTDKKFFWLACCVLALGTLALYAPVAHFAFIDFDDDEYVWNNPITSAGLTWQGFVWAFNGIHVGNWHPLSWLAHELDCQLFGLRAGAHHLVNVAFHIANTVLLFALLRRLTGAAWRSAVVAAFFAWHPLHVESVAWIAERKDVLSTFFWLLALMAYVRFANLSKVQSPKSKVFYTLALISTAAALLSKPMAVTLPFTLLLLDLWPLERFQVSSFKFQVFFKLIIEKIPFFVLSLALCAVTFLAQHGAGAMSSLELSIRLANVPVAYLRYLEKTFWPADLSIIYPYVYHWPALLVAGAVGLLALVSGLALWQLRGKSWFAFGWFWFLGTLVPVIGFIQVGAQAMADRYFYIPSIGLFIALVWGAAEFCAARPNGKTILSLLGGAALAGCVLVTSLQISVWQNSQTLFLHALGVTHDNYVADNALGKAFERDGDGARALVLYREAVRIEPRYPISQYNLGLALIGFGLKDEALEHLAAAAHYDPRNADALFNLGVFFAQNARLPDAVNCFNAALAVRPEFAAAHARLAETLVKLGKISEAEQHFREALRWQPDLPDVKKELDALPAAPPKPAAP